MCVYVSVCLFVRGQTSCFYFVLWDNDVCIYKTKEISLIKDFLLICHTFANHVALVQGGDIGLKEQNTGC